MSRRVQLVRLIGSSLALLIASLFASEFSRMQVRAFINLAGFGIGDLPSVCVVIARYSAFGLFLGPIAFGLGYLAISRDPSPSVRAEVVATTAFVLSILIVLACLLAWQLPYAAPVAEIG